MAPRSLLLVHCSCTLTWSHVDIMCDGLRHVQLFPGVQAVDHINLIRIATGTVCVRVCVRVCARTRVCVWCVCNGANTAVKLQGYLVTDYPLSSVSCSHSVWTTLVDLFQLLSLASIPPSNAVLPHTWHLSIVDTFATVRYSSQVSSLERCPYFRGSWDSRHCPD